jgi:hypothetical protein
MHSADEMVSLGAWKAFILLPIMLLRTPTGEERDLSTRPKWARRFAKFWGGELQHLLLEANQYQSARSNFESQSNWINPDSNVEDPDSD